MHARVDGLNFGGRIIPSNEAKPGFGVGGGAGCPRRKGCGPWATDRYRPLAPSAGSEPPEEWFVERSGGLDFYKRDVDNPAWPDAVSLAELAAQIGISEARRGVIESAGPNRGPDVDIYQMSANNTLGQMWCAKFVWWCFETAAVKSGAKNPFPRIYLSPALQAWAERAGKIVSTPRRGDVFVKEQRHTGLVTGGPVVNGTFPAVEGNTWIGHPAKPEGVYETTKTQSSKCAFIRLS